MKSIFFYLITSLSLLLFSITPYAGKATLLNVHGAIGPAVSDYIERGITKSQKDDLILIQLDTPGGLYKSMRQIVSSIVNSSVPVIVYVAPKGARAASAGTFILYASTVAVMAPGTHVGAASPINMSPKPYVKGVKSHESTSMKKVTNDAVAYIRTLAELRERDIKFAEQAVINAKTLTASEAFKLGVINFIAEDREDLLKQLNGMEVLQDGHKIELNTKNLQVKEEVPDWRMKFLWVITDPTLAYLLLLLGMYGIFFELVNPGFLVPGVIGAVAVLVGLYALHLLPINYTGLGLLFLGIAFIIAEYFSPSFGALGLGGSIAFIIGSVLLIDSGYEGYQISFVAIILMVIFNAFVCLVGLKYALQCRGKPIQNGTSVLIGIRGKSLSQVTTEGQAIINGEIWSVYSKKPIKTDCDVIVIRVKGIYLEVEEISEKGE
jgi:membrane-bound serine protease (ClpP class)